MGALVVLLNYFGEVNPRCDGKGRKARLPMQAIEPVDIVQLHKPHCALTSSGTTAQAAAAFAGRRSSLGAALAQLCTAAGSVAGAADRIIATIRGGGRVLVAGNGGSAAEAQHFATELVGRFNREREPFAAIALTADTAILTAIANDYGFAEVFARQVAAYGRPGDLLVLFSTSGESENVLRAAHVAAERGIPVVALTGGRANRLAATAELAIQVPATDTPLAQELHTIVLHVICDIVESALAPSQMQEVSAG
jgi:D-sedoheptulose 7-phosphate isomerase